MPLLYNPLSDVEDHAHSDKYFNDSALEKKKKKMRHQTSKVAQCARDQSNSLIHSSDNVSRAVVKSMWRTFNALFRCLDKKKKKVKLDKLKLLSWLKLIFT